MSALFMLVAIAYKKLLCYHASLLKKKEEFINYSTLNPFGFRV
jgi:hypothetical protein